MRTINSLIILLFGLTTACWAQFSHKFTQTAQIADGGDETRGSGVAVAPDGTVFLANGGDGLRAYRYDGTSFTNTAHINDGGGANGVTVAPDSTVFLANGGDGLRAYRYDGTSFTNTAHIDDDGSALGVAVANDGTVFLANGGDGLRAYRYDGKSLTNIAHIYDSGERRGEARNVVVAPDGSTIFLANRSDGLRVYRYNGNSFTNIAHDNTNTGDVIVASDSTVFAVTFNVGRLLRAYYYDGKELTKIADTEDIGFPPRALALGPDGTIFLSISWGDFLTKDNGLWAYTFDGVSFTKTAYAPSSYSEDVTVTTNGTVFNAARSSGLIAYTYSGTPTNVSDSFSQLPREFALRQNYPNPFNPTTIINYDLPTAGHVELRIYNTLGQEIRTLVTSIQQPGTYNVTWDGRNNSGMVVPSGVYFYQLQAGAVVETRKMILMR
jgi:hypothetical protein